MADYKYYNQRNYPSVPYPSPANKTATIKSGGCGVCCTAMIVTNLTGQNIDIPAFAQYTIKNGARVNGGTDMHKLANAICRDYGLVCETTNKHNKLLQHLQNGGMAIANVSGNRKGYTGIFSDSGHYVVVAGASGDTLSVLDPALYGGKFSIAGRKGKVTVSGNICYCNISILAKDVYGRNPAYYLFNRQKEEEEDMPEARDLTIMVKGHPVTVKAVNINGSNYILLRDLPKLVPPPTIGYNADMGTPTIQ